MASISVRFGFVLAILLLCSLSEGYYFLCGSSYCDSNSYQSCCCRSSFASYCCSSSSYDCLNEETTDSSNEGTTDSSQWVWNTDDRYYHQDVYHDYHDYSRRDHNSGSVQWWGWFLVCVGSVVVFIVIVGIAVTVSYRRSQNQQYVVQAPLLQPTFGPHAADNPVNRAMYPLVGPPPSYFDSEPTQPTNV